MYTHNIEIELEGKPKVEGELDCSGSSMKIKSDAPMMEMTVREKNKINNLLKAIYEVDRGVGDVIKIEVVSKDIVTAVPLTGIMAVITGLALLGWAFGDKLIALI